MGPGVKRIQTRHPQRGKTMPRIDAEKYTAVRRAVLKVVPKAKNGIPFSELAIRVAEELPEPVRRILGSVSWYTTTVKLDLEARGEIERITGITPQRIRRR
jgi:hypothetical protein